MPEEARKVLGEYVDRLRLAMHLNHWRIGLKEEEPDELTVEAATFVRHEAHVAEIQFRSDVTKKSPDETRQLVIHELLHVFMEHFAIDCKAMIDAGLSEREADLANRLLTREYERMTEDLAVAIAEHFPLIEWPETPGTDSP